MERQPETYPLTITLPSYDRELRYEIRLRPQPLVITPKFNFREEETRYHLFNWFLGKRLAKPKKRPGQAPVLSNFTERKVKVDYFLDQLEQHSPFLCPLPHRRQQSSGPHWPDEVADIVFTSLRTFGFDAIRLNAADARIVQHNDSRSPSYGFLVSLDLLGTKIGQIIRDWQKRVLEENDLNKRRRIQKYLRDIGKLLALDRRGKGEDQIIVPARKVKRYYYEKLFACEQAKALLKETGNLSGCRRWQVRLPAVCDVLSIPLNPSWWGFSEQQQVLRQLHNAKESAIFLTARHFSPAKEQTIRNILSR